MWQWRKRSPITAFAVLGAIAVMAWWQICRSNQSATVTSQWIEGSWVSDQSLGAPSADMAKTGCETDYFTRFERGGTYYNFDSEGRFALNDDKIELTQRKTIPDDDSDDPQRSHPLQPETMSVTRADSHLLINGETFHRCPESR